LRLSVRDLGAQPAQYPRRDLGLVGGEQDHVALLRAHRLGGSADLLLAQELRYRRAPFTGLDHRPGEPLRAE
jgi:hypothetical protein